MLRIMIAFILGGTFAWMTFFRSEEAEDPEGKGPRYRPYLEGWLLPSYAAVMLMAVLFLPGWPELAKRAAACMIMMFLHISLYFVLLLLAQPFLRRHLRAGSCALLWLTPNYLYLAMSSGMVVPPRWVISLPQGLVEKLAGVWLAGAPVVLGWKIFSHLRFRRWLLRGAEEVSDPAVLAVWQAEVDRAREKKPKFRLVTSPQASTPITIGLFSKSVRVVLPQRHYTPEELKLIFRHELVHIGREDAWNKFFVAFCIAMCWFNPLMWLAMGRSSEDLELSCDETVLSSLGEGERRQYADLILRTAGDGRGFTPVCLPRPRPCATGSRALSSRAKRSLALCWWEWPLSCCLSPLGRSAWPTRRAQGRAPSIVGWFMRFPCGRSGGMRTAGSGRNWSAGMRGP